MARQPGTKHRSRPETSEVRAVGQLKLTGRLIPMAWLKSVVSKDGSADMEAIVVLADIVYWYSPTPHGERRFYGEMLQRSYRQLSEELNLSRRAARRAIDVLEEIGVIKRHFRKELPTGDKVGVAMYLELCPEVLAVLSGKQLTKSDEDWEELIVSAPRPITPEVPPEFHSWCAKYRLLDGISGPEQWVSWVLYQESGIEPNGKKKDWLSACSALWEASGEDLDVLKAGVRKAEEARLSVGLTLVGPRSFHKFVLRAKFDRNRLVQLSLPVENGAGKHYSFNGGRAIEDPSGAWQKRDDGTFVNADGRIRAVA